ncbi:MAG: glycosyltransferase family 39 protein [Phycisphaerae bacterium]|nr:glycosyltransferase family 39 protein [Phycisphaerae bacterium]
MALLVALLVRLYVVNHAENIARDGTVYLHMARQLAKESPREVVQQFDYHPGFPAAVAAVAGLSKADWPDGWIRSARAVSLATSLLALACLYFIAAAVFDRTIAFITVLLFGVSRAFTEFSCDVVSEPIAVAFVMLAVALGLWAGRKLKRESFWAVALAASAGLAAGLGYLTRPEHLLAAVIAAALLLRRRLSRRGRAIQLASISALIAATLLCVLPYAIAIDGLTNKKHLGDFVLSGLGGWTLAAASWPIELLSALRVTLDRGRVAMGNVVGVLAVVCWATWIGRYVFRLRLPSKVVIKPAGDGLVAMFSATAVMILVLTALEFNRGPGYLSSRHALMPVMLLSPAAGAGLVILARWTLILADRLKLKRLPRLAVGGWLVAILAIAMIRALPTLHETKACYRQAGQALREKFGGGNYVLSDNNWVKFFADAPAGQFTRGTKSAYILKPQDLATPETLLARADTVSRAKPQFIAITTDIIARCPNEQIISQLFTDERFESIGKAFVSSKKHKVWLFRTRLPRQTDLRQHP